MFRTRSTRRLVWAIASLTLLVEACGGSGKETNGESAKSGPVVEKDAAAALGSSGGAHVIGNLVDPHTKQSVTMDLHVQPNGASGTIGQAGGTADIIIIGVRAYVRGSDAYLKSLGLSPKVRKVAAGHWLGARSAALAQDFSLRGLTFETSKHHDRVVIEEQTSTGMLDGQPVVIVRQSDGSELDVAASGPPYPLRVTSGGESNPTSLTFSEFGTTFDLKAPSGALELPTSD